MRYSLKLICFSGSRLNSTGKSKHLNFINKITDFVRYYGKSDENPLCRTEKRYIGHVSYIPCLQSAIDAVMLKLSKRCTVYRSGNLIEYEHRTNIRTKWEADEMERNEMMAEIIKNFIRLADDERKQVIDYAERLTSEYNRAPDAEDHREAVEVD